MKEITNIKTRARRLIVYRIAKDKAITFKESKALWESYPEKTKNKDVILAKYTIRNMDKHPNRYKNLF